MASYRHLARIAVMQTIFEYEFLKKMDKKDLDPKSMLAYNIRQLSSKIKDANKELLLENLFEKIPEPQALNFEEYMSYYDKKYLDPRSVFYKPTLAAREIKRRGQ